MKKSIGSLSISLLFLFNFIILVSCQNRTDFYINRKIILNWESEKQEIVLPISEQYDVLTFEVKFTNQGGNLTIEIYDPKGEKQNHCSIGSQSNSLKLNPNKNLIEKSLEIIGISNRCSGKISKTIKNPMKGNWIVKVIPKNTKGVVNIKVY
jgi:hypothetical protein